MKEYLFKAKQSIKDGERERKKIPYKEKWRRCSRRQGGEGGRWWCGSDDERRRKKEKEKEREGERKRRRKREECGYRRKTWNFRLDTDTHTHGHRHATFSFGLALPHRVSTCLKSTGAPSC